MASINNLLIEVREKTVIADVDLAESLARHIEIFNATKAGILTRPAKQCLRIYQK